MDDSPSRTAEYMALFRALETGRRGALCEDRAAVRFLSPPLRAAALAARVPLAGALVPWYIDRRWPGPRASGVVRTKLIDDLVGAALRDGATQLVLLGAGYDTRGRRLAAPAGVHTWEVDHPRTQARKRAILDDDAGTTYVGVDFEHDTLAGALAAAGFPSGERCCVVWEGVFSYLTLDAIDATLGWIATACAPGSRAIITYVDERALDGDGAAWIDAVRDVGEPFVTGLHPDQAPAFFAQRGLAVEVDVSTREAAVRLLPGHADRIPGFYRVAELRT